MEYRRLGKTGMHLSVLSFGSWVTFGRQFGVDVAAECLKAAYDAGINFFDNAEVYARGESETVMGEALRKLGLRQGSYALSTKFYWGLHDSPLEKNTLNRKRLMEAMDGSLQRMQRDCIDLIFCHRDDPNTEIAEIVHTMHDIIVMGKAHYWGTSEWSAERINEAIDYAEKHGLHAPQMEQPQYSLFERRKFESEIGPTLKSRRYGTTTWSPLASGILSGKYDDGIPAGSRLESEEWLRAGLTDERLGKVRELKSIADELGCSRSQIAIAWCAKNPLVTTVITGASKLEQLHENLGALEVMAKLDEGVMAKLDRLFPA